MIIRPWEGHAPAIHPTARLAENVSIIGDVSLAEQVSIWYGAVLRGDAGSIRIGADSNVQDNCVLHGEYRQALTVGERVTVGHGAILHGCTVEDGALIGMGATVLDRAVIGAGSVVGAGALVPAGKVIPPRSLVVGVPGKVVRTLTEEEAAHNLENAAHYVDYGARQLEKAL